MKIFRGDIGVEITLEEFTEMIENDTLVDELLELIYELEMEITLNNEEYKEYEEELLTQMNQYEKENDHNLLQRILDHLEKYGE